MADENKTYVASAAAPSGWDFIEAGEESDDPNYRTPEAEARLDAISDAADASVQAEAAEQAAE